MQGIQRASLSIWRDRFIFTSPTFVGEKSCRPATVVVLGTKGNIELATAEHRHVGRAFLVAPNVARTLTSHASGLYSLNIDPINPYSRALCELIGITGILNLDDRLNAVALSAASDSVESDQGCAEVRRHSELFFNALFPEVVGAQPLDVRIEMVSSWLWTHVPGSVDLSFLARLCGLSASRLAHLFTEQVGISIRQYLLWVKMRIAAELFIRKRPISEVAHEIGFADSSHLSRTFTRYFALTPSYLANDSLVRLRVCDRSPCQ